MSSYHSSELAQLPQPGADQIKHSSQLIENIVALIEQSSGIISFADYMQQLLYAPGFGYYSGGMQKFGEAGDFVTAPEVSSLFGRSLGRHCQRLIEQGFEANILEFGAGSGQLCLQITSALEPLDHYYILELSADLRQRQLQLLSEKLEQHLFDKIIWLDYLPENFNGILVANEVLDAMPVNVVVKNPDWIELGVGFENRQFVWKSLKGKTLAATEIETIEQQVFKKTGSLLDQGYCTEVNLNYGPWFNSLFSCCNKVSMILIDYGYERQEYYHSQRRTGTLVCFYRHRSHPDPFVYPGLQDVTAFVDFDAVADAAEKAGFEVTDFESQASFLLKNGLLKDAEKMQVDSSPAEVISISQQIKTLTLPGEMGEKFKVLQLKKLK